MEIFEQGGLEAIVKLLSSPDCDVQVYTQREPISKMHQPILVVEFHPITAEHNSIKKLSIADVYLISHIT